jgi:general secretion pathway protein E
MTFALEDIAAAGAASRAPSLWLATLSEKQAVERPQALDAAAALLGYAVLGGDDVGALAPTFDLVSYGAMLERLAMVGEYQGRRIAVIGLPLLPGLGVWLAGLPLQAVYLADPQQILHKLESLESSFSAVAEAVGEEEIW